jgi:acetyltransferase-like isoleucine patch superfamily enzyme
MPQSVTDVVPADRQNRPADRRTGRIGRLTWMFASFIAVQAAVCAVAALPFVLLARELVVATADGWLRWAIAAAAAVPAYALFAMTLMVCSAVANRMAGWRTPPNLVARLSDLDWPLLTWVRYVSAIRLVSVLAGTIYCGSPIWTMYLRLNGARIGRRVYVNSTRVSDHNLIEFDDDVVVGADVHISGHTVEGGMLKTGTVRIGRGATVGLGSVVDIDVEIGAWCQVGAMSLVPKHARLEESAVYVGIPVRRLE